MKFSYRWLHEFVDLQLSPEELAEELTFSGIEVEVIEHDIFAEHTAQVVVAEILSQEVHPYKDNLYICIINDGKLEKQVVCGAPNCVPGLKTAYIPSGVRLGDTLIEKITIKGIESDGMLCSEKDINLSAYHEGIIELPEDAKTGHLLKDYYDLNDDRFEVEITPNRPDLLGLLGISRDIAAILDLNLKAAFLYDKADTKVVKKTVEHSLLDNQAPDLCSRYIAKVIKGVSVSESPLWIKKRLKSVGIKPVNSIVDISNLVMMEFGHPLHAFDLDLLNEKRIVVRRANTDENIDTLDNKRHKLLDSDLVIADADKPVAIAGIIGGIETSITTKTINILLEAANFNYSGIRKTANRLKIFTDSSHRFERNLSDETVSHIANRAAKLIIDLCGGVLTDVSDSYPVKQIQENVTLRPSRANKLLNTDFSKETIIKYLEKLELRAGQITDDSIEFSIPHFRKDLTREIDLIEELIRIYGYNNVQSNDSIKASLTDKRRFSVKRNTADFLCHCGFYEAINSSFSDKKLLEDLELPSPDFRYSYVEIDNPIGSDSAIMRTSLLPGLLNNLRLNISNGQDDIKLFEIGKIYYQQEAKPIEKLYLTGIVTGNDREPNWKHKTYKSDIFTVKGVLETLLSGIDDNISLIPQDNQPYIQKGQSLSVKLNDNIVGDIGKLDPLIAKQFDIQNSVYIFDIDLEAILSVGKDKELQYSPIVRFPEVERDISFIVSKDISHYQLVCSMREADTGLIKEVKLIDEFTGKDIPSGYHSLTYRLTISSKQGTLTDNTIQTLIEAILRSLSEQHDIKMR